jgi:hypothetical protein
VKLYRKLSFWAIGIILILTLIFLIARIITESKVELEEATATPESVLLVQPTRLILPTNTATVTASPTHTEAAIVGLLPTPKRLNTIYAATQTQIAEDSFIPDSLNELKYQDFIIMPPDVISNIRKIFAQGETLGHDPHVFSRVGDSTIEYPVFLTNFDTDKYNLGDYDYLQNVIDYYAGSFDHRSLSVRRGLHTWSVLDPMWAGSPCEAGEHMLECEIRLYNPSIIFVRLGSNDAGIPNMTEASLREIVAYIIEQGVVPILGTKADRIEGSNSTNEAIQQMAKDFKVPLWDFDAVASTLPNKGLGSDFVHPTFFFPYDWTQERGFTAGHGLHNLSALIMLDAVWQVLMEQKR